MSLSRNLVDLYVLASAVTKVGTSVISSQSNAVCMHVKTSSLLNPTTKTQEYANEHKPEVQQHIEVPFPDYVENTLETKSKTIVKETFLETPSSTVKPVVTKESVFTKETQDIIKKPEQTKVVETTKTTTSKETLEPSKVQGEAPIVENIVKEVTEEKRRELKESRIPTSRFGRMWNYGTLATGMGFGAINESLKRATGLSSDSSGRIHEQDVRIRTFH